MSLLYVIQVILAFVMGLAYYSGVQAACDGNDTLMDADLILFTICGLIILWTLILRWRGIA